jgi:hypothetical protein
MRYLKMSKLERDVKKDIRLLLERLGGWHYMPVHVGYGVKGVPDFVACIPLVIGAEHVGQTIGVFTAIEAKTLNGRPTPLQTATLDMIRDAGGYQCIIRGTRAEAGTFKTREAELCRYFRRPIGH